MRRETLDEIFERALQEIEENIDKLPLSSDALRAYRIAKSEIYAVHQREECIIPADRGAAEERR
ncbi:MAG: hypothetical protein DRH44_07530 [Candidatus Coatesbacteria bacterium]|nr:MAG: hypothetical protein DRH44_07530 [Candidatus Coatesbacteria bacterium]